MDNDLVGSGRWSFEGHEAGANFTLERNPTWRIDSEPFLEGIQYNLIQDQAQALAAFRAGEIDVLGLVNVLERDQIVGQMGDRIFIEQEQSRSIWYLQMAADGRFADQRVREAISLAMNRDQMIELFALGEAVKTGLIPPSFGPVQLPAEEMNESFWKEDVTEANVLLDAAGFDREEQITLKYIVATPQFSQFAKLAGAQLEENLGLNIKVVGEDFGTWLGLSLYGDNFDLISYPTLAFDDPNSYLGPLRLDQPTSPSGNWSRWYEQEVHDLIVKQRLTLDAEERFEIIHDIQRLTWEKGTPIASTNSRITNTAVQSYVKGRPPRTRGAFRLYSGQVFIDRS